MEGGGDGGRWGWREVGAEVEWLCSYIQTCHESTIHRPVSRPVPQNGAGLGKRLCSQLPSISITHSQVVQEHRPIQVGREVPGHPGNTRQVHTVQVQTKKAHDHPSNTPCLLLVRSLHQPQTHRLLPGLKKESGSSSSHFARWLASYPGSSPAGYEATCWLMYTHIVSTLSTFSWGSGVPYNSLWPLQSSLTNQTLVALCTLHKQ